MILYKVVYFDDLNITQNTLLAVLYALRNKQINVSSIATALHIDTATIYRNFKELQEKEYVFIDTQYNWQLQKKHNNYMLQIKALAAYSKSNVSKIGHNGKKSAKVYKRETQTPAWYDDYKKELIENSEKCNNKQNEYCTQEQLKEITRGLFND